ncbi:hypothetical protein F2P56_027649 [Juglans regia]|uniref:Leucine-rich repeat-containing N-terminal plant-type domain-containing protein n=1 Tax=Juglans regia TaxID=51240 RepID=A0A833WJM9_JUGRE|nr:hypothetical protein F2P56_027649 [Juglans regia]
MGLSFPLIILIMRFLVSLMMFYLILSVSSSGVQPMCHDDERFALLQFKESYFINQSASRDPTAYPKVSSWKPDQISDCCKWDGVECNKDTGHVIGLDLSSSCLKGFLNSNSSLFRLAHLQNLNLDDNDFNSSPLPTSFRQLSRLTVLSLAASIFSGQIPSEIFKLSKLVSLNLSYNPLLKLQESGLTVIAQNLSNLEVLSLKQVDISSNIPNILANLSSLTSLSLSECDLHGEFPVGIFHLPKVELDLFLRLIKLVELQLSRNNITLLTNLSTNSTFPKFRMLLLAHCDLGEFPEFLRNQDQLELLDLGGNKIHGQVPKWMGNVSIETLWGLGLRYNFLTGFDQLPVVLPYVNLKALKLDSNMLQGSLPIPPPSIAFYSVSNNSLAGEIPHLICNLSLITELHLSSNNLSGNLPQCLGNLSASLTELDLHNNSFHGTIP